VRACNKPKDPFKGPLINQICTKNAILLLTDVGYGGSLGLLQVSVTMFGPRRPHHEGCRRY
jgi:hypothetical protein